MDKFYLNLLQVHLNPITFSISPLDESLIPLFTGLVPIQREHSSKSYDVEEVKEHNGIPEMKKRPQGERSSGRTK